MIAETFNSGFKWAHDTYAAISAARNGKIYYILCSEEKLIAGRMYAFDPIDESIDFIGDLSDFCGLKDSRCIAQGKSHVPFYEKEGVLFFGTHVGHYEMIEGMERLPASMHDGIGLYPGGHFLSYDMSTGKISNLVQVPNGEGILTMAHDGTRNQLYGITWPSGHLIRYDLGQSQLFDLGPISKKGEAGAVGQDYRVLCRSMFVDPRNGNLYFTVADGDIYYYHYSKNRIEKFEPLNMRLDYFGHYLPDQPGSMAYNWRRICWHPSEQVVYGIHGNSGYLFRLDVAEPSLEIVRRLTSMPSQQSGMYDQYSYGYLGFDLAPDGETIYYLTGSPIYENGKRVVGESSINKGGSRGLENLHLITYHIPTDHYTDHGPIFYSDGSRPTFVNSIAINADGDVYTLARMEREGRTITDLVKISNPFQNG